LKNSFEEAAENYLELCEEVGKDSLELFKGSFNVRLDPSLHLEAFKKTILEGKSLNQLVQEAIEQYVVLH
jgi:predicted HicB family RNase H-like nuclease